MNRYEPPLTARTGREVATDPSWPSWPSGHRAAHDRRLTPFATGTNHVPLGTVPSGGSFTVSIRAPRVRAPLDERTIHYQALFLDVGGPPVWSNMQTLLVLDSQF